jgi:integrase/recombinase XerD
LWERRLTTTSSGASYVELREFFLGVSPWHASFDIEDMFGLSASCAPVAIAAVSRSLVLGPPNAYLASLAPGSRRAMRDGLEVAARMLVGDAGRAEIAWHLLRRPHLDALRARLADRYAPATANRILSAVRGVLRVARDGRLIAAEDFELAAAVPNVRGSRLPAGRALSQGELRALFGACDPRTPLGARDAALLALLYGAGLRRAEVAALDVGDYDEGASTVRVLGKGNKERVGHLPPGGVAAVAAWLEHRGRDAGALLHPLRRGGHIEPRRMSDQAILLALRALGGRCGVTSFSPHDCRRTFIGDLLDLGVDIATVQKMVGHSSPQTTARYDRRPEAARRHAAGLLHVPFAGRAAAPR